MRFRRKDRRQAFRGSVEMLSVILFVVVKRAQSHADHLPKSNYRAKQ